MSARIYRCALIGCGDIGGGYDPGPRRGWGLSHAGAYRACPRTRLVAAADTNRPRLAAFGRKWGIRRLYTDYGRMLAEEPIDILSVCLPPAAQPAAFNEARRRGVRAYFLEKPLAANVADAARLARLARKHLVAVNYFRRWNPTLRHAREELRANKYGRVLHAVLRYTKGVYGNGSHLVDLTRWFWGEPREVRPLRRYGSGGNDPGADFSLRFPGGFWAHFLHVPTTAYVFIEADILAERGRLVISQRGQELQRFNRTSEPHYGLFQMLRRAAINETQWRRCMVSAVAELSNCLDRGGRPSCTPMDALAALRLCRRASGRRP